MVLVYSFLIMLSVVISFDIYFIVEGLFLKFVFFRMVVGIMRSLKIKIWNVVIEVIFMDIYIDNEEK